MGIECFLAIEILEVRNTCMDKVRAPARVGLFFSRERSDWLHCLLFPFKRGTPSGTFSDSPTRLLR